MSGFPGDLTADGPDDLYLLCQEYLDACNAALALSRGGTISRAFSAFRFAAP